MTEDFAAQIAKLTPEQRQEVIRGINESFDVIRTAFREVSVGLQAVLRTIYQLPPINDDEAAGAVWSQLMADIDELIEPRSAGQQEEQ
ncbi:hypothetical protein ABZ215_24945 [Amycolatopsis sp. NPDC006131]|uniref:hypothetical protein n=1 Tax=Amycolatopsis sp. NPDC006131 TaxID=3156731 RepID=UPI0033AEF64D